ncbi:MAG: rhodanese-like domain-containing protein [bacterium]|nr:rhodanese-like domain-containing protein [bacterium]
MATEFKSISAETARKLVDAGARMIDVRSERDWAAGHVEGADRVPRGQVDSHTVGRADSVIAVCADGSKSKRTAKRLAKAGYSAYHLTGGLRAWDAAGFPLRSTDGNRPTIL